MHTKNILLCSFSLSSILFGAMSASAQLVFDDFDAGASGTSLVGQNTSVGGATYEGGGNSFLYDDFGGNGIARPNLSSNDATNSFSIPGAPTAGNLRFDAVVNFNENQFSGVTGTWIGLTGAGHNGLLYGAGDNEIALRFFTVGTDAGRIQLRTDGQTSVSSEASALQIFGDRDYLMTLSYNFDTLQATATVTDTVLDTSTSASYTLSSAVALSKGQFDFTGVGINDDVAEVPYFKSISIVPEPSVYALLGGCLVLAFTLVRRRR